MIDKTEKSFLAQIRKSIDRAPRLSDYLRVEIEYFGKASCKSCTPAGLTLDAPRLSEARCFRFFSSFNPTSVTSV